MPDIVDVYEMTPVQAGMLMQTLRAPESGVYLQQYWCRLDGPLDVDGFRAAWDQVIGRHDILRTQCQWEGLETPVHVIHDSAQPEWLVEDWRETGDDPERLDAWLATDRARGFDMGSLPLMRFALFRVGEQSHVFVWSFHHLLIDGWCGALLVREMLEHYRGAAVQSEPVPFASFVEWLAAQDSDAAEAYWREALAGIDQATPLGIDHAATGDTGALEVRSLLPKGLTEKLADLSKRERLTLNTLLQGAWALILSRYTGQTDVCFGSVLSGRPPELPGIEKMIGLFLTTVPARVRVENDQSLLPWLDALQADQRGREANGHVPLTDIQSLSGMGSATPLFESLLIVETYPQSIETVAERGGAALRMRDTGIHERTNYPLTIKVLPGEQTELCLTADAARLDRNTLERLAGHFEQVLSAFASAPDQTLGEISLTTAEERAHLMKMGQGPARRAAPLTLGQILARALAEPDAEALRTLDGHSLSYDEVDQRSGRIARALVARGIGRGDVVAVCQDRTADLVSSLLAIWRAGAAYLPLDPIYPADRIRHILTDAEAALAIVDDHGLPALGHDNLVPILHLAKVESADSGAELIEPAHDDLAYILYTSGSTGKPKGVRITHGALANFLTSMLRAPGLAAQDRLLAVTTVAFDIAALELFGPLYAGGTVVLGDAGLGADGLRLSRALDEHDITVVQATPAGWRVLCEAGWRNGRAIRMLSGGEALDAALARRLLERGGALWNLYGPTETTIWSAAMRILPEMVQGAKTPVGGPIDNTQLYVLDHAGHPAPAGVAGELLIGGAGLGVGYHNRPDLTADRFICDTITGGTGKLYRTGDNVRFAEDGSLEFLGRLDDQVKLRGFRIELGEIEARLEAHPDVLQAVTIVRDDGASPRLVAYLRCASCTPPAALELRSHLEADLPAYMLPSSFVMLDAFPLTPNGKINRRALPEPEQGPSGGARASLQIELVGSIWAGILGVECVEPDDDFFDLGGHSLLATGVIGAVEQALSVELSLRDLFEAPRLEAFCARVAEAEGRTALPPIGKAQSTSMLSFAQQRQWLMAQFNPADTAYLLPLSVRLTGPLDVAALRRAFSDLVSRHEVLRSSFPSQRGEALLHVHDATPIDLPVEDLGHLSPAAATQALAAAQSIEGQTAFDISAAPPWRARMLSFGAADHVLLITMHHILADEWSFGVLLRELNGAYARALAGNPDPKPDALQYSDYASWQHELDLSAQLGYWRWQLEAPPRLLNLPNDFQRPTRRTASGGRVSVRLDHGTTAALRAFARAHGVTLYICLLSAYALFLHRHTDEEDLLIGTPVSNRHSAETQDMIGLFVNTLAIRADFQGNPSFTDLLRQIRETLLAGHNNRDVPFEQVIDALDLPRSESHAPLVQTLFSMQTLPEPGELQPGLSWRVEPGEKVNARFDLSLNLADGEDGLEGYFEYASDLFAPSTVALFAQRFQVLLGELLHMAETPVSDILLLGRDERASLLAWSKGPDMTPAAVLDLIAAQDPDGLALDHGGYQLRYADLQAEVAARALARASASGHTVSMAGQGVEAAIEFLGLLAAGAVVILTSCASSAKPFAVEPSLRETDRVTGISPTADQAACILMDEKGLRLTHVGLARMGATPLASEARLEWDGSLTLLGLQRLIAGLCNGATLTDTNITAQLEHEDEGFVLKQGGETLHILSTPELPMAFVTMKSETPAGGITGRVLGELLPGVTANVLQSSGQLAPIGVAGELCLGGTGLARGYQGQPGLTADRFRPNLQVNPQAFDPEQACLWRSGWRARRDPSGAVHLLGRIADQVAVAGQRVTPADIEAQIASHPAVVEAALKLPEGAGATDRLEVVLVLRGDAPQPTDVELHRHVLERLPDYLAPRRYHWVEELPRDSRGTLDRDALIRVGQGARDNAPVGAVETGIAAIWGAVLKRKEPGRHDNFFDLGGDSILAMQIVTRMREEGYAVEPRELFQHQTIAELAQIAGIQADDAPVFDLPDLDGLDVGAIAAAVSFGET